MKYPLFGAALLAALASSAVLAADPPPAAVKAGCTACHAQDRKLVGPAYKDVATKYKGEADAVAKLSDKVRKGGSGVWGPIPMPPNGVDKIGDVELKTTIEWVLKS